MASHAQPLLLLPLLLLVPSSALVVTNVRGLPAIGLPRAAPAPRLGACRSVLIKMLASGDSENKDSGDAYSVDWDTAWQTELSKRRTGAAPARPEGREPVPEFKVVELKVRRAADDAVASLQMASSDWKLWVGLLLGISVLTAIAAHSSSTQQTFSV
jgi:hypothetical protein|eukprot:jgi/Chrpa1/3397/Chrysochromulina_OHIO_Genome00014765-RA